MAVVLSDPKLGLSISMRNASGENLTKTFNYVNLTIGTAQESPSGYTAADCMEFVEAITNLTGFVYRSAAITAQYNFTNE